MHIYIYVQQYNLLTKTKGNFSTHFSPLLSLFWSMNIRVLKNHVSLTSLNCVYCHERKHSHVHFFFFFHTYTSAARKEESTKTVTFGGENTELENRRQNLQFGLLFLFLNQMKASLCLSFLSSKMVILISDFLKVKASS